MTLKELLEKSKNNTQTKSLEEIREEFKEKFKKVLENGRIDRKV